MIDLKNDAIENKQDFKFTKLWMAIPCFLDTIGSTLSLLSLLLMPASLNMMFNGGNIIFTTIVSRIMLGRKILNHNALGCLFSLIGFIIVGYSGTLGQGEDNENRVEPANLILGLILTICYLVLVGIQGNTEELILRKKAINVQRMIGLEGMFGLIWSIVVCILASFFACPNASMCNVNSFLLRSVELWMTLF